MKRSVIMRGDAFRYAMEHAEPELAKAIWHDLMTPKPSKDKIREKEIAEIEARIIQARKHVEAV